MKDEIFNKLKQILEPHLGGEISIDQITMQTHLINELNIDSAHIIDIILDVENEYDIAIDDDLIPTIETLENMVDAIQVKLDEQ